MNHFHLPFYCPCSHAAAEELLFRNPGKEACSFLTYINAPSVHIGRHQALDCECNRPFCLAHRIPVLRRISGGGAVYHDRGVLNYALLMPRAADSPEKYVGLLCRGINKMLGLTIRRCPRNSLWLGGHKIAGTAFAMTGMRLLIHGCILVNADLKTLQLALSSPLPIPSALPRAVRSVRSPVANLTSVLPDLTPEKLSRLLHRIIQEQFSEKHSWQNWADLDFRYHEQQFLHPEWHSIRG